jgi:flagellar hook protein FlgE
MVGAIGGVRSVFVSAVTGLRAATENLAQNASAIAHQSVLDYQDSVRFSSAGRALAAKSQQSLDGEQPSLERSLVGELVAKHDFAANVTSLRTADEVLEKLVHLGDRGR